ncbi:Hpt domain-containing protein [Alcanivorax sp. DP30]|nr:Hpt domain-containing protein [Alcanivorax sp. DP30]
MGDDFSVLVESFIRDGEQRLQALKQALGEANREALRAQAHSFKGSSSNLGAVQVCELCLALETLAVDGELGSAPDQLDSLEGAFQKASQALREL